MEDLNTNTENVNFESATFKKAFARVQQNRDHFEERLKIEIEKREALENKIASFLEPMIERILDDHVTNFKDDLEEKIYELESRIDDIDNEVDIGEMVATELTELIHNDRLTVKIELDWLMDNQAKDISDQLLKSYKVLDDARAKLENLAYDINTYLGNSIIDELDDQHHSDLLESIQDWLGQIYSLDCEMAGFVKDEN